MGYWFSERKKKKFPLESQRERLRNAGIDLVEIDLSRPMEQQGPFDLLIHKITDLLPAVHDGEESLETHIKNFEVIGV
ncbi:hypothetical protein BsWGS_14750 [Bradybaena similaris]